jgi:hypothetical protein
VKGVCGSSNVEVQALKFIAVICLVWVDTTNFLFGETIEDIFDKGSVHLEAGRSGKVG